MSLEEEIKKLIIAINDLNNTLLKTNKEGTILNDDFMSVNKFCKKNEISKGLLYKNIDKFQIKKIGRRTLVKGFL